VEASYVGPAVIHITAVDPLNPLDLALSGVKSITYILNGGTPVVVLGTSATVTVTEPGLHTLSFYAEDNDLNIETAIDTSFDIEPYDLFPPVTVSDVEAVYLDSGVITLTATDDVGGFGVDQTYWILDGAAQVAGTVIAFDEYGPHTLSFWSTDLAGNIEVPVETDFFVDDTLPPVTTSNALPSYTDAATITFSPSDGNGSGVVDTWYILDGGTAVMGTSVTVSAAGDHTVDFWSVDAEGNAEAMHTVAFTIGAIEDATAPVSSSDAQATYATSPATIRLTSTDEVDGSGIAQLTYIVDGGTPVVVFPAAGASVAQVGIPITSTIGAPASTVHHMGSAGHTVADNCGPCHPGVPGVANGCASCHHVAAAPDIFEDAATPANHGVMACDACHTVLPVGPGDPNVITVDVVVSGNGNHTIEFWGEDVAGNVEAPHKSVAFTIGAANVAPVLGAIGNKAATVGVPLAFTATATDADLPAQTLAFSLGAGAPAGAAITAGGAFSWTPSAAGSFPITVRVSDGTVMDTETITVTVSAPPVGVTPVEVAGPNRYATAIAASVKAFTSSEYVIIATGMNWPDALGGSALAGALDAPILLTGQASLPVEVRTEIVRLGATKAIVLGGTPAVSAAVAGQIDAIPGVSVERIFGSNRYDTAIAVAARTIQVLGDGYDGTAFVATGLNFPDALGASPLAAAAGWPIYLANPNQGNNAGLVSVMRAAGVDDAILLGGANVVSDSIRLALGTTYETRLSGANRYDTAVVVATYGVANAGLGWNMVALATGENFPDALAGGVLQGEDGSALLLTPTSSLNANVAAKLTANKASISEVRFLGSTAAVSQAVRTAALNALQ
jgi:putative cell wall-binding protein